MNVLSDKNFIKKGVFYLMPLFFLIFTFGSEFIKFYSFILLLSLFIFGFIFSKKYFNLSKISIYTYEKILGLFLLLIFFSSILADNRYASFFGANDNNIFSFFSILIGASFFLLLAREKSIFENRHNIVKWFFYSSVLIFSYKIIFSFFPQFNFFEFKTEDLIILASLDILLFLPLLFSGIFSQKTNKILLIFLVLIYFLISVVFYKPLFLLLFLIFIFQLFLLNKTFLLKIFKKKVIFLLIFILFFGFVLSSGDKNNYKIKVDNLDLRSSVELNLKALSHNFLFGTGLGSYSEIFSNYRPASLNYTNDWNIRFKNSYSFFCNLPGTVGFFASLSFLSLIFYILFLFYKSWRNFMINRNDNYFILIISAGIFVLILPFLITFTFFSFSLFLLILALSLNYIFNKEYVKCNTLVFENKNNILLVVFYILLFLFLVVVAFSTRYLFADFYASDENEVSLLRAVELNPHLEKYDLLLSKIYLDKAKSELNIPNKDYGAIARDIDDAKKHAENAMYINPNSVVPYESLGIVYRDIANYSTNGEIFAINPLLKAFSLEPSNPVLATELGKLYLLQKDNVNALKYFNIAYSLKKDYPEASLGLARVMVENNNNKEAIDILNGLKVDNFDNSKIFFELGRAYFNINNNREAIENFQKAVLFDSHNSNALYGLALSYERIGDSESAFIYYKKTQELNPGNLELIQKLEKMK